MPHLRRIYLLPPDLEEPSSPSSGSPGRSGCSPQRGRTAGCAWRRGSPRRPPPVEMPAGGRAGGRGDGSGHRLVRRLARAGAAVSRRADALRRSPRAGGARRPRLPDGRRAAAAAGPRAPSAPAATSPPSLALELLEDAGPPRAAGCSTWAPARACSPSPPSLFGARSVVGFDVDPASPFHARDNSAPERPPSAPLRRPPGGAPRAPPLRSRPGQRGARADPPRDAGPGRASCCPAAEAILSGILAERGRQVLDRMRGLGFVGARPAGRPATGWRSGWRDEPSMITLLVDPAAFDGSGDRGSRGTPTGTSSGRGGWRWAKSMRVVDGRGGRAGGRWSGWTAPRPR